jgi:lysine N6-hydroxylase
MTTEHTRDSDREPYELVGIGVGPFNLALAALADGVADEQRAPRALFLDQRPSLRWHPGLLLPGTTLQVPFLADLVTLVDPTSRWSFLSYLRAKDRLFPFYFAERFHVPRLEYDDYLRWVADGLESVQFGARVRAVTWESDGVFRVAWSDVATGARHSCLARHVVLGLGTAPRVPDPLAGLLGKTVFHSAEYAHQRPALMSAGDIRDVTVVGSGQSGAEVVCDLLRAQPEAGWRVRWLARTPAFAPMEYSKLGLEHFTPDHTAYFHRLPQRVKDALVPAQWQLYKGVDQDTLAQVYDLLYEASVGGGWPDVELLPGVEVVGAEAVGSGSVIALRCRHGHSGATRTVHTDRVVCATGYAPTRPLVLEPMGDLVRRDEAGRLRVDSRYRVSLDPSVTGRVYVQNGELHTHGVGAPDLGLGAWRAAVVLNDLLADLRGQPAYRLPPRTAFTTFGLGSVESAP